MPESITAWKAGEYVVKVQYGHNCVGSGLFYAHADNPTGASPEASWGRNDSHSEWIVFTSADEAEDFISKNNTLPE